MGTKMVSLRVDEELLGWATGYAKERGVSRTSVVEAALRSLREDCGAAACRISRTSGCRGRSRRASRCRRLSVVPPVRRLSRSKQSELAMARMRAMDPRRYG
jgi:hypothetical protein